MPGSGTRDRDRERRAFPAPSGHDHGEPAEGRGPFSGGNRVVTHGGGAGRFARRVRNEQVIAQRQPDLDEGEGEHGDQGKEEGDFHRRLATFMGGEMTGGETTGTGRGRDRCPAPPTPPGNHWALPRTSPRT